MSDSLQIKENVELAKYTSFRVGGPGRYFVGAKTLDDIIQAVAFAKQNKLPIFVLGGGTNLLISDIGFPGLVIKNQVKGLELEDGLLVASTGVVLPEIHNFANSKGLVGFEKLATVPGTLGGALYNNAHWSDDLLSNYVQWVDVLIDDNIVRIKGSELEFAYDTSIFKTKGLIALQAGFLLPEGDTTASKVQFLQYIKSRTETQPYGTLNSGCMFQNVQQNLGPGNHGTSAGYLIDQVGLKGARVGQAEISSKHGNFFLNNGGASSKDILELAELCRAKVKEKYGVELEYEIKII